MTRRLLRSMCKAAVHILSFSAYCSALIFYLTATDTAAAAAFRAVMPTLLACYAFGCVWACAAHAEVIALDIASTLTTLGAALQLSLQPQNFDKLILFYRLALLCGVLGAALFQAAAKVPPALVWLTACAGSAAGFVLLRLAPASNGTHAWLSLGSFHFQLTEPLKLLLLAGFAAALANPDWPDSVRAKSALLLLAEAAAGFVLINELGTLCVLLLVYLILSVVYLPFKHVLRQLVFLGGGTAAGVRFCSYCLTLLNPKGIFHLGFLIGTKLTTRLRYVNIADVRPFASEISGSFYQSYCALRTLLLSEVLGPSAYRTTLPVAESDLILVYQSSRYGVLSVFTVAFMAFVLFVISLQSSRRCGDWRSAIGLSGAWISVSTALNLLSGVGLLPLVGVQAVFLSAGGTGLCCAAVSLAWLLSSSVRRHRDSTFSSSVFNGALE